MEILVFIDTDYFCQNLLITDHRSPIQYQLHIDMPCCARALATLYKYTD